MALDRIPLTPLNNAASVFVLLLVINMTIIQSPLTGGLATGILRISAKVLVLVLLLLSFVVMLLLKLSFLYIRKKKRKRLVVAVGYYFSVFISLIIFLIIRL